MNQEQGRSYDLSAEIFAVIFVLGCIYYYLSLFSYHPFDPSLHSMSTLSGHTQNWGGVLGAKLSSLALFALGWGAFFLPLPHLLTIALLRWRRGGYQPRIALYGSALMVISVCCLFEISKPLVAQQGQSFFAGGWLGQFLSQSFAHHLGEAGRLITVLGLATVALLCLLQMAVLGPTGTSITSFLPKGWGYLAYVIHRATIQQPLHLLKAMWSPVANRKVLASPNGLVQPISPFAGEEPLETDPPRFSRAAVADEPVIFDTNNTSSAIRFGAQAVIEKVLPQKTRSIWPLAHTLEYRPPVDQIFEQSPVDQHDPDHQKELESRAEQIVTAFADFGVKGRVIAIQPGPVVTVFEFEPQAGTKLSRMLGLMDDIALALRVESVFILPAKGKRAIAIQVPNSRRKTVYLGDILSSKHFVQSQAPLTVAMGISLSGEPVCSDLSTMPHLLTAGATGAGKSVAINALLCSLISKSSHEQIRLILVDPKMLELSIYEGIPHLLMPVITDPTKASLALKWATYEMERRYKLMQGARVRNIQGFNDYLNSLSQERRSELAEEHGEDALREMPYIVLIIDELADLMLTAPKDVETSIQRLAQKARASGIHLILATQRPSVDILTGVIKANLPCRVAFQTVSKHDSRTILDQIGSDKLLGKGDMLFMKPGQAKLERMQGALVSDGEVIKLVEWLKKQFPSSYEASIMQWIDKEYQRQQEGAGESFDADATLDESDPMYHRALGIAAQHGTISASFLQRQLKIGYNRAARIVEQMEAQGLVSAADGSKAREWLGHSL